MTHTLQDLQDFIKDEADDGKTIIVFIPGAQPLVLDPKDCTIKDDGLHIKTDTRKYTLRNMPYVISEKKQPPSVGSRPRY